MNQRRIHWIKAGLILSLLFCSYTVVHAKAAEGITYQNLTTDSVIDYDNTAVKYHYNGVDVTMNEIGILGDSGSALAPLSDLFVRALDVDCEFNRGKTITVNFLFSNPEGKIPHNLL